jgi:TolB-like protein
VLPLTNMSGDPGNEFFGDGMTEDILTHLSRVKSLRVTSRTSVMQYKGTTKTVQDIARELGVESVLEGSIRVAGGKVRVTVQLIDAEADDHLWAESYDRSLEDHRGAALGYLERYEDAIKSLEQSIAIDPGYSLAVAVRALFRAQLGHPEDVGQAIDRLSDPDGPGGGPFLLAYLHLAAQDIDKAMDFFEQAVAEGDFLAPFIRCTPRLNPMRAHPRFQALLQRMWPDHGPFEVSEAT